MRLLKFALVGAIGLAVQLGGLAALTALRINYLLATGLAVECALIHNFLWHRRFTWRDRAKSDMRNFFKTLLRFQLSNGLISIVGNLLLMRLLVGRLRLPLLPANIATIAACFVANFLASDRWVFFLSSGRASDQIARRIEASCIRITRRFWALRWSAPASAPGCAGRTEHKPGPL